MTDFLPYLGLGLTLIVALGAFKRAESVLGRVRHHLDELHDLGTISKLKDDVAELYEAIERNRAMIEKATGRLHKRRGLAQEVPDPKEDPAAWKKAMRLRMLNGKEAG